MRKLRARSGARMEVVGQGTWRMGEDPRKRRQEAGALRLGLDLGMTLIDTAEMYAEGEAEKLVGEVIERRREEVFLVSKVLPWNASRDGTVRAAEGSLRRLGTDRIDLYLLHWRGSHPLEETLAGFDRLVKEGKIGHYGVSNFDHADLEEIESLAGGRGTAANQILYNLHRRGPEHRILPWCADRGIVVMAYSPLDQGSLDLAGAVASVARRHGVTPAQVALAWAIRRDGTIIIPKASDADHVRENARSVELRLEEDDLKLLDAAFPRPAPGAPLETT